MTTRLVLSMEASIAEKARRVSRRRRTSISALFANYIASLDEGVSDAASLDKSVVGAADLPPITRQVLELGKKMPPVPPDWDYRAELAEKYQEHEQNLR